MPTYPPYLARRDSVQPDPTTMLQLIGLRPITVDNLGRRSVILQDYGLILVDGQADLSAVADWALSWWTAHLAQGDLH